MATTEMKLPELGENVAEGDVLRVLVSVGQTVNKDQPVLELETDKATIEVPSSVEGVVQEVKVKAGDKVKTGQVIFTIGDGAPVSKAPKPAAASTLAEPARSAPTQAAREEEQPAPAKRRGEVVQIGRGASALARDRAVPDDGGPSAAAAPSVRRLARELGVEIDEVIGSGPGGRISDEDVNAHVRRLVSRAGKAMEPERVTLPDFSRWGEIERKPMSSIRRRTAQHLSQAWTTIPHVTQHDRADVTQLDAFRKKYEKQVAEAGGALTVTAMLLKVVAAALKAFPQVNV